jgi:hypothetical protein
MPATEGTNVAFFEVEFPRKIGFGAIGGPTWSTLINSGFSGYEQRNKNWFNSRYKYQLDLVAQPLATFQEVLNFFQAVNGKGDAFRFYDPTDNAATAQPTVQALGDGSAKIFQLQKLYTVGTGNTARTYSRIISKPIMSQLPPTGSPSISLELTDFAGNQLSNTVVVYLNGVKKTLNVDYTVDCTTGLITFTTAPGNGVAVTADFSFHVPVRFDTDEWPAQLVQSNVPGGGTLITATGIMLLEVRIPQGTSQG